MTIRVQILEKLKDGIPLETIRKDYTGKAALYGALEDYFIWVKPKVSEYQEKLQINDAKILEGYTQLEEIGSAIGKANTERDKVAEELAEKRREFDRLRHEEVETRKRYETTSSQIKSLAGRGLTEEALSRILGMEYSSGGELLERVSTSEKYSTLLRGLEDVKQEFNDIKSETMFLVGERKRIGEQVVSERNVLDELRRRSLTYEEANTFVQAFISEGYDSEILLGLLEVLKSLAISGHKRVSVKRLIDGLSSVRSLEELESAILHKKAEFARLQSSIDAATGELEALRDDTLAMIDSSRKSATKEIGDMHSSYMDALVQMNEAYERGLLGYRDGQAAQLSDFRKRAEETITKLTTEMSSKMNREMQQIQALIANYERQILRWGAEKEEQGRLGSALKYGRMLDEASVDFDLAKNFPMSLIDRLLSFVVVWIRHHLPDEKVRPSKGVAELDIHIADYTDYRILALIHIISDYFNTRLYM